MRKKIIITILIICIGIIIGGIVLRTAQGLENKRVLEPEEVMEYFGITDEEADGIDWDKFFSIYHITKEYLLSSGDTKKAFLRLASFYPKQEPEDMTGRDYSHVIRGGTLNGVKPDYETLKYLAFYETDTIGYSLFIDIQNQRIYVREESWEEIYYDLEKADLVIEDVDFTELLEFLDGLGIENWEKRYKAEVEYGIGWELGLEFEDGTVASFSGYEKFPERYWELREMLMSFAAGY